MNLKFHPENLYALARNEAIPVMNAVPETYDLPLLVGVKILTV